MITYDAFISYSHAKDKVIAAALQSAIQRLGKSWHKRRRLRVFRDDTSLSASPALWPSIERALGHSRYFILLGSPEAASSNWVGREVSYWLEHKSIDTLLIGLTDSELLWNEESGDFLWGESTPLPPILRGRFSVEPRWIDLRSYRYFAKPTDTKFTELSADFAAVIHGLPKEDVLSQEVRQQRRALKLAWSATAAVLGLACAAGFLALAVYFQWQRAEHTLRAATQSTNSLIVNVAVRIRQTVGMPLNVVRDILDGARSLQDELIKYNERDRDLRRSQAVALREVSQTLLFQGALEDALASAEKSLEIMEQLTAPGSEDAATLRELSRSLNRKGEALSQLGRHDEAMSAFQRSVSIGEGLALKTQDDESQRDLAISYERLGDEWLHFGRRDEALDVYRSAFTIRDRMALAAPENILWQADLANSYDRIGRTLSEDFDQSLTAYLKSLGIWQRVVVLEAWNSNWQRSLAAVYDSIGTILLATGKREEAVESFKKGLEVRERLATSNPDVPQWEITVAISMVKLAEADDAPIERYRRALEILRRLASRGKLNPSQTGWVEEIEDRLKQLGE